MKRRGKIGNYMVFCVKPRRRRLIKAMARILGFTFLLLAVASICEAAAIFNPISEAHRSAAMELFSPAAGSFSSLEEVFEALRTFEVLGIDTKLDLHDSTCKTVVDTLSSESSNSKDLYHALRVSSLLKCKINKETLTGVASRLQGYVKDAKSLLDFYHSIGGLTLVKVRILLKTILKLLS
ncbi:hypothetical protein L2E82_00291 [Cichorium intybus]|uniref:Uncharacterized protein n=1 Tax=Cichorium intybus TaxID=13427 RepID=A0ACB9GXM2_CICIN|nr:hypothetical protein L2E82_00291 [Cichorium intybus]